MYRHGGSATNNHTRPCGLQAVIFDLDGTLADTLPVVVEAFELTFDEFGLPIPTQGEIFSHFGPTEDGVVRAMFGSVADAAIPVFYKTYGQLLSDSMEPFPGIRDLIAELHANAYRLAVVTGKSDRGAAITLDALHLDGVLGSVRGGSDDGIIKAAAIGDLVDEWNIRPTTAVYIGDHPLDVAESRKAGVGAISAAWASTVDLPAIESATPDEIFHTVRELATWLQIRDLRKVRDDATTIG